MSSVPDAALSRARLFALLEASRARTIAVVGDAMLDVYLRGDVERISPEAPVPVVRVREKRLALGGAANVAANVAATGANVRLVATIGDDNAGADLRAMLERESGSSHELVTGTRPTTTKTRIVARSQQLVRVDEESDRDSTTDEEVALTEAVGRALATADALILEDYNKGVLVPPVIGHALRMAAARGIPVVVDPKYRNFFSYRGATVFKPNRRELEAALGAVVSLDDPATLPGLLERLGVSAILLTLSERGMVLIERRADGTVPLLNIPTAAREVYDVVGAGDTVTAYLALMLAAGATLREAAVIANVAAGVEVGKLGAATVSHAELVAAWSAAPQATGS